MRAREVRALLVKRRKDVFNCSSSELRKIKCLFSSLGKLEKIPKIFLARIERQSESFLILRHNFQLCKVHSPRERKKSSSGRRGRVCMDVFWPTWPDKIGETNKTIISTIFSHNTLHGTLHSRVNIYTKSPKTFPRYGLSTSFPSAVELSASPPRFVFWQFSVSDWSGPGRWERDEDHGALWLLIELRPAQPSPSHQSECRIFIGPPGPSRLNLTSIL